jgi:hypothetical protein
MDSDPVDESLVSYSELGKRLWGDLMGDYDLYVDFARVGKHFADNIEWMVEECEERKNCDKRMLENWLDKTYGPCDVRWMVDQWDLGPNSRQYADEEKTMLLKEYVREFHPDSVLCQFLNK